MQKNKICTTICIPWVVKWDIVDKWTKASPCVVPMQTMGSLVWFGEIPKMKGRRWQMSLRWFKWVSLLLIDVFLFVSASYRYYIICFHHGRNRAEANSRITTGGHRKFGDQYLGTWTEAAPTTFRKTHVHQNPDAGWNPGGIWSSSKLGVYLLIQVCGQPLARGGSSHSQVSVTQGVRKKVCVFCITLPGPRTCSSDLL